VGFRGKTLAERSWEARQSKGRSSYVQAEERVGGAMKGGGEDVFEGNHKRDTFRH